MLIDLHNHTPLCNHATGTPLALASRAYELGCKYYGFADHAFMPFEPEYRMSEAQIEFYEDLVKETAEHFRGKMEILLGFEVDFMGDEKYFSPRVMNSKCDFLIGSVHFLDFWGFDNPAFIGSYEGKDIDELYSQYFHAIAKSASCGRFDILGHIDLIKVFNYRPKKEIKILAQPAIKAIKEAGVCVELNSAGWRKPCSELYPSDEILELLADFDAPITFSSDAHSVAQVGANMDKTIAKARQFGYSKACVFKKRERVFVEF